MDTFCGLVKELKIVVKYFLQTGGPTNRTHLYHSRKESFLSRSEVRVLNQLPQKLENNIKPLYGIQRSLSVLLRQANKLTKLIAGLNTVLIDMFIPDMFKPLKLKMVYSIFIFIFRDGF